MYEYASDSAQYEFQINLEDDYCKHIHITQPLLLLIIKRLFRLQICKMLVEMLVEKISKR